VKQQAKLWTVWVARTVKFIEGHFMLVQAACWNIIYSTSEPSHHMLNENRTSARNIPDRKGLAPFASSHSL